MDEKTEEKINEYFDIANNGLLALGELVLNSIFTCGTIMLAIIVFPMYLIGRISGTINNKK